MANILGLALKVTGDASGLAKSLTPVERALDNLGKQAEKATNVFTPFADKTAAAGKAQEEFAAKFESLAQQLRDGVVAPEQYAAAFGKLSEEAKASAAAFEEGLRITREVRSEEERRAEELGRLQDLLERGAISQETFVRASERATGVERERADAAAAAARIIAANLTPQEKYDQQITELTQHLDAGRLSQEQFNRAAQKAKSDLDGVGSEAAKTDKNIERLNNNVSILAKIEIGRLVFDGVRALGSAFASAQNQISGLVTSANASINQLDDFAQRTGIGVEALQGYSLAANLAGVDTEQFGTAVQRLAVSIGKATPGDALDKSLRAINLSVGELRALSPEQQFSAIGNAISTLPTVADRAAAAVEVFGKQGAALAPLFREGAASIEELQAQAERLGIIVDETQVNNVTSMNDAFDLVAATVQGIIGQVEGNLAPVVTAVTDEFLRFVESFASTEGTGGTGIANAITDVLLRGAEYFAAIFDEFVGSFTDFSVQIEAAANVFQTVSGILEALSGTFKSIFNTFEIIGNGIAVALGKALEAIGSYVSSDLEAFGKDLQVNANAQLQNNLRELEAAGQQIIDGTTQAVFGNQGQQQAAAAGAASTYLQSLREQVERERAPEFQIATNIEKTRERFDVFFGGIVDQSSVVTDAMRGFEAAVAAVEDPLRMNEEEITRIKVAQDKVNEAISQEQEKRQTIADAAAKQADAKRIESLTKANDAQSKLAEDIAAVERERARVQQQQAAARDAYDKVAADAATARLAQLDQLGAKLADQQQAADQGFGDGFTKAFDATNASIGNLINKAAEFGNAGARAAQQLQEGIAAAQERARDGILTQETYDREVARQREIFDQRIAGAQRVEEFLRGQLDERQRAELDFAAQVEERKRQAALNVQALQARIDAEQQAVQQARDAGNLKAAKEGADRLKQLRQAEKIEKGIAAGRINFQQQQAAGGNQQFGAAIAQQQRAAQSQQRMLASANDAIAATARAGAELARRAELARPVQGPVATADIRTAEGAALVLGLGAQAQDPQLIEARLQTKQLAGIRTAITNAVAGYLNTPAEIF